MLVYGTRYASSCTTILQSVSSAYFRSCCPTVNAICTGLQKLAKRRGADTDSDEAPDVVINPKSNKRRPAPAQDDLGGDDAPPEEDPFYVSAAQQAQGRKKQKADKYTAPAPRPPLAEPETQGPRKVSKAVEKNRGLTPHRRRDLKNPRVKVSQHHIVALGSVSSAAIVAMT